METNIKRNRIALVVGAGGVKCAAALGMWKVLEREGIPVDFYIGCSGGSLYSSLMALGFNLDEVIQHTISLWTPEATRKRKIRDLLSAIFPGLIKFNESFAMIDDSYILEKLSMVYKDFTFSNTRVPLAIVATDFHSGEPVILEQGLIKDAIRASIAIPYIWSAWPVNGRLLIDGSLSNPMPVDVAIREGFEIILAMGFESPYPRKVKSLTRYAFHLNSIITNNLFKANFAFHNLAHHAEIIHIIPDFDDEIRLFDTQKILKVIASGETAMQEHLPYLRKLIAT